MALSDWIGTLGVTLLLVAFALNIAKKITPESKSYLILNIFKKSIIPKLTALQIRNFELKFRAQSL